MSTPPQIGYDSSVSTLVFCSGCRSLIKNGCCKVHCLYYHFLIIPDHWIDQSDDFAIEKLFVLISLTHCQWQLWPLPSALELGSESSPLLSFMGMLSQNLASPSGYISCFRVFLVRICYGVHWFSQNTNLFPSRHALRFVSHTLPVQAYWSCHLLCQSADSTHQI